MNQQEKERITGFEDEHGDRQQNLVLDHWHDYTVQARVIEPPELAT